MIRRMEDEGLVAVDGTISSPTTGTALAEQVVRRHRLAERFLTDILGLSWAEAHTEAGKWEHVISEPVEEAMTRLLGDPPPARTATRSRAPTTRRPPPSRSTTSRRPASFTVTRIPEELEFAPGLLEFLEEAAVCPARPARSPRHHPTAPSRSRSTAARSASARSPAPASSSPPA